MSTELVHIPQPISGDIEPVISVEQAHERYEKLRQFVQSIMREGPDADYGVIPGTNKKSLLKPGAEKLCRFFGLSPRYELLDSIEDWTGEAHGGEPLFYYRYACKLYRGEQFVGEAQASINSREDKYRYRNADRKCPECGKATIKRSKFPPRGLPLAEPGWYCYAKIGGCGMEFEFECPEITSQQQGKVFNDKIYDLVNTLQQMAQKRAYTAATRTATNASEFFTDTLGDSEGSQPAPEVVEQEAPKQPEPAKNGKERLQKWCDQITWLRNQEEFDVASAFNDDLIQLKQEPDMLKAVKKALWDAAKHRGLKFDKDTGRFFFPEEQPA